MGPALIIILAICAFIAFCLAVRGIYKYFGRVYRETGINPLTIGNQLLGLLAIVFPLLILAGMGEIEDTIAGQLIPTFIAFGVMFGIIFITNLKFKRPLRSLWISVLHILFGVFFIIQFTLWLGRLITAIFVQSGWFGQDTSYRTLPFSFKCVDKNGRPQNLSDMEEKTYVAGNRSSMVGTDPFKNSRTASAIASANRNRDDAARANAQATDEERFMDDLDTKEQDADDDSGRIR